MTVEGILLANVWGFRCISSSIL